MTIEEKFAEILTRLEEMNTQLRSLVEPSTSSSSPSTPTLTADTENQEREISASTISTKPATTSSASLIPSPTSAPPQDADPGIQSGVTEFSYIHHTLPSPPVSTDGDLCILFDANGGGVDRFSCLPDSLLVDHAIPHLVPRSLDRLLEQIRLQQQGRARLPRSPASTPCSRERSRRGSALGCLRRSPCSTSPPPPLVARCRPISAPRETSRPCSCSGTASRAPSRRRCSPSWESASSHIVVADQASASVTSRINRLFVATARKATITARVLSLVHTDVRHLPDTFFQLTELQDVTRATPIGSAEFLSAMHTRCSMQGHGSDEVTTLSLCAFSMTAVAIKGTLHHKENTSELLRILLLLEPVKLLSFGTLGMSILGVFKDWQEQPWPPPMLVEILGSQVEDSIIELRPNPWPSFEHSVYLIHRVSYMLLSCDTNLQQLGNLTGFSIIWDVSILNLFADPSKCRVQWKPPWVSYVGRNIAGHCPTSSFIMVFLSLIITKENWKCMVYISGAVILEFWWPVVLFQSCHTAILFDLEACKLSCGWIITGKLFNSTDGHERYGFSFEENCPAMQGDMAVGLVLPWYQQSSLCFHLLADTRRTMMHFNQDKQLQHYGKVLQPTYPLSFLLACYKIGQSGLGSKIGDSPGFLNSTNKVVLRVQCLNITVILLPIVLMKVPTPIFSELLPFDNGSLTVLWDITLQTSPQGHADAPAVDVNWSSNWVRSSFEERRKWWLHQKLIVVLWISIIKDFWQVILWDPGGAKPLTIRLMVFLLQPRSSCWWYKNSNRCCIIDSSNYWSSWVLVPCLNIGSETTSFLNASMQQILLQDSKARVQGSQFGPYLCYLKQLNDDWCHGRFILSIMIVRVTWDPGGSKFVRGFAATAWGQAVFQGGENVMILLEILWAGPIKGHGLDLDQEKVRTGLLSRPRRKASEHKRTTTVTARSVEGPEHEAGGELCSRRVCGLELPFLSHPFFYCYVQV